MCEKMAATLKTFFVQDINGHTLTSAAEKLCLLFQHGGKEQSLPFLSTLSIGHRPALKAERLWILGCKSFRLPGFQS